MVSPRRVTEPAPGLLSPSAGRTLGRPPLRTFFRVALALTATAAIVGGSPLVGAAREALLNAWPSGYVPVLAAGVIVPALAILVLCVRSVLRVRAERPARPRWQAAATATAFGLALVVGYAERTGDPNVDVVEAFHFVEFGVLTCLFVWAAAPLASGHAWVWAPAAAIVVGALDEWTQWFVPNRIGEIRDVALDAVAAVCGVLVAVALGVGGRPCVRHLTRPVAWAGALALVATAACFGVIHLGSIVRDEEAGAFPTRFDAPALVALGRDRASRWASGPIAEPGLFAREDQYLSEALWHVRRRNQAVDAADTVTAWREQRILERYFAPILAVVTADRAAGHALSAEQRALIEPGRAAASAGTSDASPIPIVAWPPFLYWTAVAGAVGLLAAVGACGGAGAR